MVSKKLWRKFTVCNVRYSVVKVKDLNESGCIGLCDPVKMEILIDAGLQGDQFTRVLFHELIHAVTEESGLGEILDSQAKEMVAETFAGFLTATMKLK